MTQSLNPAGISKTAPHSAAVAAETTKVKHGHDQSKVMLLAIHKGAAGDLVFTPIDVEHETDNQTGLSALELTAKKNLRAIYDTDQEAMKRALGALFEIFDQRLYREQFRSFENFCFAIFELHRIPAETVVKAKAQVKKLKAALPEEQEI